jgi:hypothetical protein
MALSFGDIALSIGAGVAEKDMQYMQEKRNADFNLAMEEFKDNKSLVTKLAENRYSRDINKYDEEVKKYDALKSVYSAIENDKLSPFEAAFRLASVNDPNWGKYDKAERIAIAKRNSEGFDYTYYKEGDIIPEGKKVGDKKSFSVQHDKLELTEPTADKYFLDSSYWKGKGPDLNNFKGESIFTNQIQKLLGKTDADGNAEKVDMSNYIADLEKLKTQDIKSIIGKETYSSSNISDSALTISEGNYAFGDGTSKSIPSALSSKYTTYSGVATNDVVKSIIAPMNAMKIKDIDKYFTTKENGEVTILPGGTSAYIDGRELYNNIVNDLYYNIVYAKGKYAGREDLFTDANISKQYNSEFQERSITIDLKDATGVYVIPTDVLPLGVTFNSLGIDKNKVFDYVQKNFPSNKSLNESKGMLNGLVLQYIKNNAKQLTNIDSDNTNNVNNKGSGKITLTEKIIEDTIKENPNMSREDIIKGYQNDVRFNVPENLLNNNENSNSNKNNNLDNLIKKDKNTGVEYIPFG